MNVHPKDSSILSMSAGPDLIQKLEEIRRVRAFNPDTYVHDKCKLLNKYMARFGLATCVVAVSGGIDSAVVLGLVKFAQEMEGSPIKNIIPVLIPAMLSDGVTNQLEATSLGKTVCERFGLTPFVIDISIPSMRIKESVDAILDKIGKSWAEGQLVPVMRTPVLYYIASLHAQNGEPAIICGTTNKDEGAYLGYVGKASDGMVDVQLISDIHKSEVYAVAEKLGVPRTNIEVVPTGNMFDKRTDVEVFGAPYDFVELYLDFISNSKEEQERFVGSLDVVSENVFLSMAKNLENLHKHNFHKYLAGSPAIHLDLYENNVPGKWGAQNPYLTKLLNEL